VDGRIIFFRREALLEQIFFSLDPGGFMKILEFSDVERASLRQFRPLGAVANECGFGRSSMYKEEERWGGGKV
jgi:hypothetical protein